MANNTSQHILGTAANLLGFCLFGVTSLHISDKTENSLIDEFTSLVSLFLTISCILSFMSIRTNNKKKEVMYERTAEYIFMVSLIGIFSIIGFIIINYWNK